MKTFIVLVSVYSEEITNPRGLCEEIESVPFSIEEAPDQLTRALKIRDIICKNNNINDKDDVLVLPISDFMDMFNNQNLNADDYYMGYVTA